VDEGVDVLYDVGVGEFLHDVHFPQTFLALALVGHVEDLNVQRGTLIFLSAKGRPCSFYAR
jgi:hypothetical protein